MRRYFLSTVKQVGNFQKSRVSCWPSFINKSSNINFFKTQNKSSNHNRTYKTNEHYFSKWFFSAGLVQSLNKDDKDSKLEKPVLLRSKDREVNIHVWFPKGQDSGHVSLSTPHIYGSLRSDNSSTNKVLVGSLEEDVRLNGREPDKTITLYSLDVEKISRDFNAYKNLNNHNYDSAQLVARLLSAGEGTKLLRKPIWDKNSFLIKNCFSFYSLYTAVEPTSTLGLFIFTSCLGQQLTSRDISNFAEELFRAESVKYKLQDACETEKSSLGFK